MAPISHFPHPRSFLNLIPLRPATSFLLLALAINKVTGLYGILALFTGYHLNFLQLSHYIYNLVILVLVCYLSSAIRAPRHDGSGNHVNGVVKTLALAWVYVVDAVVSSVYTLLFASGWFVLLARQMGQETIAGAVGDGLGMGMMNDKAGFTNPQYNNVSKVEIVATPAPSMMAGQQATAYASTANNTSSAGTLGEAVFQSGSMMSLTILVLLWVVRIYACLIVLSFARSILRSYIVRCSASAGYSQSQSQDPSMGANPFQPASGRAESEGWRGKLGRVMLRWPSERYWLGRDESENEWARQTSSRLEGAKGMKLQVPSEGVGERERRARSGTGPPMSAVAKGHS
ncbi:hypothetical protein BAUCODRAFT_298478 [Baudoinia panamericana UAMH 10762]|uniref:DUF1753-domain-containing protein n=1 Tax=Baudoinia panamericana (strain UAMH 10762) TaxID=717646 RepID=M2MJU9_BAUPA|nr:uncharacterized protein BAUCODRAFT_298478 [Baudoinia panamericana UAMH 10762]EMC91588.1 hypothetical protein BAUCODRAFT_298478 [Baudoinia panamericana UAMH 10762]